VDNNRPKCESLLTDGTLERKHGTRYCLDSTLNTKRHCHLLVTASSTASTIESLLLVLYLLLEDYRDGSDSSCLCIVSHLVAVALASH
jgi:hypothetical protein